MQDETGEKYTAVRHLGYEEAKDVEGKILPTDILVVPARDEGPQMGAMGGYAQQAGFTLNQIIIMVNDSAECTVNNKTEAAARGTGAKVFVMDEVLTPEMAQRLRAEYGIEPSRLKGKGTAMFAACLKLEEMKTPPEARIFFLDADITNLGEVSPIQLLLAGWVNWNGSVKMVKLASLGRNNEGILAFLGLPGMPYTGLGALQWPLCGQMSVRWGELRRMRGATKFAIEMAMLIDLIERYSTPSMLGEVELGVVLNDKKNDDHTHAVMYRGILAYISQLLQTGRWKQLHSLTIVEMIQLNLESGKPFPFWVPPKKTGSGASSFESHPLDAILPSIEDLFGK
jgi:hypothetical protein